MSTSARVIKNTSYLYIKMGITMFVSLYSTRLILASLGASDFGLFNVVGGAIGMMGFLNSTMANATQRFMSYAEGEGQIEKKRKVFNVSMVLHVVIALITIVLLLLFMFPLFNGIFNIEPDRINAAVIIYLCLVLSTVLTIVNVPYDAVMNAHENMLYYSIVGIFESLLRLAIAFVCVYTERDKLIVYGILMACIPLITLSIMKIYCHKNYDECVIAPCRYWDGSLVNQIAVFSGWNFLTAISSLFSMQGIGIVLNHFFGTVLNAAQGISNQVNGVLSNFSGNMRKALNPVITKSAGSGRKDLMNYATLKGCKFSTLLMLLLGIPLSIEIHYVLELWLKEVPDWGATFVVSQLIMNIIVQMAGSAATAVYAQGDIKYYAIWKSIMNAMPLVVVWLAFRLGGSPIWLYIPMIVVWSIGGDVVIVIYAKHLCGLNVKEYYSNVIIPVLGTFLVMLVVGSIPLLFLNESFMRLILTFLASTLGLLASSVVFALTTEEKNLLISFVKGLLHKM